VPLFFFSENLLIPFLQVELCDASVDLPPILPTHPVPWKPRSLHFPYPPCLSGHPIASRLGHLYAFSTPPRTLFSFFFSSPLNGFPLSSGATYVRVILGVFHLLFHGLITSGSRKCLPFPVTPPPIISLRVVLADRMLFPSQFQSTLATTFGLQAYHRIQLPFRIIDGPLRRVSFLHARSPTHREVLSKPCRGSLRRRHLDFHVLYSLLWPPLRAPFSLSSLILSLLFFGTGSSPFFADVEALATETQPWLAASVFPPDDSPHSHFLSRVGERPSDSPSFPFRGWSVPVERS